jgi:[ribosomal protein S5]-alanine N-acetyltransferase
VKIETERLRLRELTIKDAGFIRELVNEPAWKKNIGDKKVNSVADAALYILNGPIASYKRHGFGLYLVELKETGNPIGICGLIKRDTLEDVDIGFAFLEKFWSKGYAYESASAVMEYGRKELGINRVVAITVPDNIGSIKVLEKIGLRFEKMVQMPGDEHEIKFFSTEF